MMDGSTVGDGDAKTLWIGDLVRARSRQDDVAETRVAMRYFFSTTTPSTRRPCPHVTPSTKRATRPRADPAPRRR